MGRQQSTARTLESLAGKRRRLHLGQEPMSDIAVFRQLPFGDSANSTWQHSAGQNSRQFYFALSTGKASCSSVTV